MTKETNQPKAINIIRPSNTNNNNLYSSLSHSSSGSTTSTNSTRRTAGSSLLSATSTNSTRKPRVAGTSIVKSSLEKPILNLYHPPTRKPSYDNNNNNNINIINNNNNNNNNTKRPTIELYKPPSQQQKMTKSFTAPSLTLSNEPKSHINNNNIHYNRPISPSYIRPQSQQQQQQQQYHRSVLGVINTPVAAPTAANGNAITYQTSPSEIVNKPSPLITDQQKSEELDKIIFDNINQNQNQDESGNNDDEEEEEEEEDDDNYDEENIENELDEDNEDEDNEDEDDDEEEPVINEARVNRKIADLELSINSLLTVNAMLEATVRKQALQLNQIKKQKSLGEGSHVDFVLDNNQEDITDQTDLGASQDEDEDDWENDALFQKLRKVTEHMIEQGQKSIDFEYKILGRVLSNYAGLDDDDDDDEDDDDNENEGSGDNESEDQATISKEGTKITGTTNNTNVASANSSADIRTRNNESNTIPNNTNITVNKKPSSSIPRNINKFTKRRAPRNYNINIST